MANNATGKDAAPKGRPSGDQRGGSGLHDTTHGMHAKTEKDSAGNYLDSNEKPAENVKVRHENRNENKGENDGE